MEKVQEAGLVPWKRHGHASPLKTGLEKPARKGSGEGATSVM